MSTNHAVRRLYPGLRARTRFRRQPWHAHVGDGPPIVRDVSRNQHGSESGGIGPLTAENPGIFGLSRQVIVENIRVSSYTGPNEKTPQPGDCEVVRSVHGVPDRGPTPSHETTSGDDFRE